MLPIDAFRKVLKVERLEQEEALVVKLTLGFIGL